MNLDHGWKEKLKGKTLLLVDDTPQNIDVLRRLLEGNDFNISVALNGTSAIEIAKKVKPLLILLDVMMPGIDGFETCRRLKAMEETRNIPIIFITALTNIESIVKAFECGGCDYVSKPFQQDEVLYRVATQLKLSVLLTETRELNQKLDLQNEELIEAHNVYRNIVECVSDGVFRLDADQNITQANPKFCVSLGYEEKQLVGKPIKDLTNLPNPEAMLPQLATRRSGDRATHGLSVQFCVNKQSPIWAERKYHTYLVESFGIWNLPNDVVYKKNTDKKFLGSLCILREPPKK